MNHRQTDDDRRSTRRSYFFYSEAGTELSKRVGGAISVEGFYTYMLYQDLQFVVPFSVGREEGVRVRIASSDVERAMPLVAGGVSERMYSDLQGGIQKLFATVAQHLVFAGSCTYEIEYLFEKDTKPEDPSVEFHLQRILAGTVDQHHRRPIQYVLPTISPLQLRNGMHYVELDAESLITFNLPEEMKKPVRRMVQFLRLANAEQGREFGLMQQAMTGKSPYVFSEHKRMQRNLFAEATEPIGWNTRDLFKDQLLEPFSVWRQIRFLEFKVRLRESILTELNRALLKIGKRMNFDAAIEFQGLPTSETVASLKEQFRTGARGFGDMVNDFH